MNGRRVSRTPRRGRSEISVPSRPADHGDTSARALAIRGRPIAVDDLGRVRLNDLHKAGGYSVNKTPSDWTALEVTRDLVIKVLEKTTGKSGNWTKSDVLSVLCTKKGAAGGTWVHLNLALAYAKYLSADLHYEVNEVFLRAKSGDATLADEVLERSDEAGNEWAGKRALGRATRKHLAAVLKEHDIVKPVDYAICTNGTYVGLFGKTAQTIRGEKGLPKKGGGSLRDRMDTSELVYVMASEQLASERIEEEDRRGVSECSEATRKSASNIARALAADRADRRRRFAG